MAAGRFCHADTVIISHGTFHDGNIPLPHPFCQQTAHTVLSGKEQIQIAAFRSQHLFMEHGINIIRPALKSLHRQPQLFQPV